MVRHSGQLVTGVVDALDNAALGNREEVNKAMSKILASMKQINATMETMFKKSLPREYTSFRTFIFGITSQSMFPNGVIYEGINNDEPLSFRGESGANDSIIPTMDNLLQTPMVRRSFPSPTWSCVSSPVTGFMLLTSFLQPDTPLSEILRDFRKYRPSNHRGFLAHVGAKSIEVDMRGFALRLEQQSFADDDEEAAVWESRRLWLQLLNEVRDFRWRHWCFAKEYILKTTSHPTATGGSPIVTWLPNQLSAVLLDMRTIGDKVGEEKLGEKVNDILEKAARQEETLKKEVARYCEERGVQG